MINFYISLFVSILTLRIFHILGSNSLDVLILNFIFLLFVRIYKSYDKFFYSSVIPFIYLDLLHERIYLIYTISFIISNFYLKYISQKKVLTIRKASMYSISILIFNILVFVQTFIFARFSN